MVYCGQTLRWIKMKLGMQVALGPGHIVLDGDPTLLPQKGSERPIFPKISSMSTPGGLRCSSTKMIDEGWRTDAGRRALSPARSASACQRASVFADRTTEFRRDDGHSSERFQRQISRHEAADQCAKSRSDRGDRGEGETGPGIALRNVPLLRCKGRLASSANGGVNV